MNRIEIVLPAVSNDFISAGLRDLTEIIDISGEAAAAHGILGGDWGYGAEFSNAIFEMNFHHEDCDCGFMQREADWCDANEHKNDCYQAELERRGGYRFGTATAEKLAKEWGLPARGCAIHCTCGYEKAYKKWVKVNGHTATCCLELPNFRHKATGFEVRWYKYIGRDMEIKNPNKADFREILAECIDSMIKPGRNPSAAAT